MRRAPLKDFSDVLDRTSSRGLFDEGFVMEGNQEVFWSAAESGELTLLKSLWGQNHHEIDLEAKNGDGRSPIYLAARGGHVECIKYLASLNADLDTRNPNGCTLVYTAVSDNHWNALEVLFELGADIFEPAKSGCSSIYRAAQMNSLECVQRLIELGCDPNDPTDNGLTPIYAACQNDHLEIVKRLYELGGSVNLSAHSGCAPIYTVCLRGYIELVHYLYECGVWLNQPYGTWNPMRVSKGKKHGNITTFLEKHDSLEMPRKIRWRSIQPELYLRSILIEMLRLPAVSAHGWIYHDILQKNEPEKIREDHEMKRKAYKNKEIDEFPCVEYTTQDDIIKFVSQIDHWFYETNFESSTWPT